jgi:cysteine desulfurase
MIYLDHNATTPLHPKVLSAMEPYFKDYFGNASSLYKSGRDAKTALETARCTVALYLGAKPQEIIFTGGGTESDNMAIRGVARAIQKKGNHIITSAIG